VAISANQGLGIENFLLRLSDRLRALTNVVELLIPYDRGDVVAAVHREGEVLLEAHEEQGTRLRARLDEASLGVVRAFLVDDPKLVVKEQAIPISVR
jgi:GTP-binding protein HflX